MSSRRRADQLVVLHQVADFPGRELERVEIAHAASLAWAQRWAFKPSTWDKVTSADHREQSIPRRRLVVCLTDEGRNVVKKGLS
jgi:hypothetical protein